MKKTIKYFCLFALVILFSCKKSGVQNSLADVSNLGVGSYITLTKAGNKNLVYNNATSTASITVDKYGGDVDKIILYVVVGENSDPASWKKVKTVPFTGPGTVLSASSQEIVTALGIALPALNPGTTLSFYNQVITKDGRKFDISNTIGALEGNSNYNAVLRWKAVVICPFTGSMAGTYTVISDKNWADWNSGDLVQVTDGPGANQVNLSQVWPRSAFGATVSPGLLIDVDPATGAATSKTGVAWGSYSGNPPFTASTGSGSSGYIFSCTGRIDLRIHIVATAPYGDQQFNELILQKQ